VSLSRCRRTRADGRADELPSVPTSRPRALPGAKEESWSTIVLDGVIELEDLARASTV